MARESKKKDVSIPQRDELAQTLADSLNKLFKDQGEVAFFLDGQEETPMDLTDWVSTGATMLDIAISNRPNGGIPMGRIIEINGLEGSGKSLLAFSIIRNIQKQNGIAVYIDNETATNVDFIKAQGVDVSKLVILNLPAIEDMFDAMTHIIEKIRSSQDQKDKKVVIVVDSIAGASTKKELQASFSKEGYGTEKAQLIGLAMRKMTVMLGKQKVAAVFTNQLRQKMNAPAFSDPWTTSGGKALAFHASVRIRLAQIAKLKDSAGNIIGVNTKAQVIKNRCGPPFREANFEIYFNRGIDDYASWLSAMKENNLIKQAGAWYTFIDEDGTETRFQSKDFKNFIQENEERKQRIYNKICEALIMKYETEIDPETVTLSFGEDDE